MREKENTNYLRKIKSVQEEFSKHDDGTRTVKAIWEYFIEPKFFIGIYTLRRYLNIKLTDKKNKLNDDTHK